MIVKPVGSATDEVDNFQLVAVLQSSLGPQVAGRDITIQFDGDTISLHSEFFDQRSKRKWIREIVESAGFPIDLKIHWQMGG